MAKARINTVWIVIQNEFMDSPDCMDQMVRHVASSLHNAEKYMRSAFATPYSYWTIEEAAVGIDFDQTHSWPAANARWYDYQGTWAESGMDVFDAARSCFDRMMKNKGQRPRSRFTRKTIDRTQSPENWLWWLDVYGEQPLDSEWQAIVVAEVARHGGRLIESFVSRPEFTYGLLIFEIPEKEAYDRAMAALLEMGFGAESGGGRWKNAGE